MVEISNGVEVADDVDMYYAEHGSQGRARADDIFFLIRGSQRIDGCVRFCVEEGQPMLRTMLIRERARRQGFGTVLLKAFENFLHERNVKNVFCLPYPHLEQFYGQIGFAKIETDLAPLFLQKRIAEYQKAGRTVICMRRP